MVTYTSSSAYWSPLKPRIRIYAFNDSTYSSPIYTYNAFTDVGTSTKPIGLNFDSSTDNVGTFSIEIEDKDYELDPDTYMRGNRVFIECSKDGTIWQPAFKGLVRSTEQNIYATSGRNLVISGYSYLIRLNERVVNTIIESDTIPSGEYNRTDPKMETAQLLSDLLSVDTHYINSSDDTTLSNIFKFNNIELSPITEWIPRLDAQMVTLDEAINEILDPSNSLVTLNPGDDQLILYNPDLIMPATGVFLVTNQMNEFADNADFTMYPLEQYRYNISYDYPDSGNRLIGTIGNIGCPGTGSSGGATPPPPSSESFPVSTSGSAFMYNYSYVKIDNWPSAKNENDYYYTECKVATEFKASKTDLTDFRVSISQYYNSPGHPNPSAPPNSNFSSISPPRLRGKIFTDPTRQVPSAGTQVGSDFLLYYDGVVDKPFPTSFQSWYMRPQTGTAGVTGLTINNLYWLTLEMDWSVTGYTLTDTSSGINNYYYHYVKPIIRWNLGPCEETYSNSYTTNTGQTIWNAPPPNLNGPVPRFWTDYGLTYLCPQPAGASGPCGGTQGMTDSEPVFAVCKDANATNRLGVIERVIPNIPSHVKTQQTLLEFLSNKLYYAAKPRFTLDFPSVSMPNILPKAGDVVAHVDTKTKIGLRSAPMQTGIINQVEYSFEQGNEDSLGLRRLAVQTTGIRRGSY